MDRQVDAAVRKDRCAGQFHLPSALEWKHPCGTNLQNSAACGVCGITEREQAGVMVCSDEDVCYTTVACAGAGRSNGVL